MFIWRGPAGVCLLGVGHLYEYTGMPSVYTDRQGIRQAGNHYHTFFLNRQTAVQASWG